ncbi:hypothetical protein C0993_009123 [Termitomyces sp. T159_Od127]|nr:hypothetical protein C0993_009123 [Termitomyces sp. T159_Od127]
MTFTWVVTPDSIELIKTLKGPEACGFGQFMANTPMVIMWPNGNDVVLSQRKAPREVMPTVDPSPPRIATIDKSLTSVRYESRICCWIGF